MSKTMRIQTATGGYVVETNDFGHSNDDPSKHETIVCKDIQDLLGTVVAFFGRSDEQYRIERVGAEEENSHD